MNRRMNFMILILFVLAGAWSCGNVGGSTRQVCFDGRCIKAEVAATQEQRAKGLQFRRSMGPDEGMLFIFPTSRRQSFWMKDTYIPLDIIWIDSHKKIVFIIPNILPCETEKCPVYTPDTDAKYVLEVNAGMITELGMSVGDQAVF